MNDAIIKDVLDLESISITNLRDDKKLRFLTSLLFEDYFDKPIEDSLLKKAIEEIGNIVDILNDYIIAANKRNVQTDEIIEGLIKKMKEGAKEDVL